jgi:hypothetical protein
MVINPDSLGRTLDSLNEAFFFHEPISESERDAVVCWIAGRHGVSLATSAYIFAPTDQDYADGVALFTGEHVHSGDRVRYVLGFEALHALTRLGPPTEAARTAMAQASGYASGLLEEREAHGAPLGTYCCAACTCALWRCICSGGIRGKEDWLVEGLRELKDCRTLDGSWHSAPFFYTLLTLLEVGEAGLEELRYAVPRAERLLKRIKHDDPISCRRRALLQRTLAVC